MPDIQPTRKDILTDNPDTRQHNTVDTRYGPPVAPQRGRGKCPHARPKRKRNRPCRQCGYYTIPQCRLGGVNSGKKRRWLTRKRDSRVRNLRYKRGLTGAAIAAAAGVCVRTVWYILNRQPFRKLPKHVQAHGLIECATNILSSYPTRAVGRIPDNCQPGPPPSMLLWYAKPPKHRGLPDVADAIPCLYHST